MRDKTTPSIRLEWPRAILTLAAICMTVWYLNWRLGTFNAYAPIFSTLLYVAEVYGFFTLIMHAFMVSRLSVREPGAPEVGKTVDVFITTYNEDISIIRRTALTALAIEYPHKTWILDDGNRKEIAELAQEIKCGYIAREVNSHAKAGNLNNALSKTTGEFIAVFDADHAPKSTFLTRTLGYFRDPEVAFVQTPQDFYNLDSYQHRTNPKTKRVWTEQSLFFRIIQRGKDVWNAAFFCGSCAVVRRTCLEAVGGFATKTITEDLHTSIQMHKKGFKSVYHAESLAFGIAAAQVKPFLSQRIRWGKGAMQVWRAEPIVFSRHLTVAQKICYVASILTYFDGWQKFVFYITPAMVLLTGLMPIDTTTTEFLWHFVPYFTLSLWAFEELGRGYGRTFIIEQYNMARFWAFCSATLGLIIPTRRFRVTSKNLSGDTGVWRYLMPQYSILGLNAGALLIGSVIYSMSHHISVFSYLANMFWATINLLMAYVILAFSRERSAYQRKDYRFSIPLTARVHQPGGDILAALQDISSNGITVVIPGVLDAGRGSIIKGEIFLPDGMLPFQAAICSISRQTVPHHLTRVGCRLMWQGNAVRNRLEQFLHGSDLEWKLHHFSERAVTPLERLMPSQMTMIDPVDEDSASARQALYASVLYFPANGNDQPGLPGVVIKGANGHGNNILSFSPIPLGSSIESRVFIGDTWQTMRGRIANEQAASPENATLYRYQLEGINT